MWGTVCWKMFKLCRDFIQHVPLLQLASWNTPEHKWTLQTLVEVLLQRRYCVNLHGYLLILVKQCEISLCSRFSLLMCTIQMQRHIKRGNVFIFEYICIFKFLPPIDRNKSKCFRK